MNAASSDLASLSRTDHRAAVYGTPEAPAGSSPNGGAPNPPVSSRPGPKPLNDSPPRAVPNWDLFRLFCVVAKTGSVNRAAHDLGMSQPTLSRRLKELERHIGAPLLYRNSSGVTLTQEGEDLRRSSAELVSAFERFNRELHSRVGQRSSLVRISASEGLTKHWLLPRVGKLRELNRRVRLEVVSTMQQQAVTTSDLDLVIRMGDPGDSDLIGKRLGQVSFGLFASEAYLATHPAPRTLAELKDHDIIGTTSDFPALRGERSGQMPLKACLQAAAERQSVLRVTPLSAHYAAAAAGLGLALLAVPFALAEKLVRVLPQDTVSMNLWLLRRRETELRKLTREVMRFLEAEFLASKGWLSGEQLNLTTVRRTG
jgi:DNA-binding transcriptional LysR family regulator